MVIIYCVRTIVIKEKFCIIVRQNFAILAIVHSKSGSFITCVFGIVLRSADYSRCTETRPRYFLRVSEFFSDSDKILLAVAEAALGAHEAEPGKPANVE